MQISMWKLNKGTNADFLSREAYQLPVFLISLGAILAAFRDVIPAAGGWILLAAFPLAWYILWIAGLNRTLIKQTVMKGKYPLYAGIVLLLCVTISLFGIALEWGIRSYFNFPHRIHNYFSIWILGDALSNAVLMILIMFGMALSELFVRWRSEQRAERRIARKLSLRLEQFKQRIRAEELLNGLQEVADACLTNPDTAARKLRSLSKDLRNRLYDKTVLPHDTSVTFPQISAAEKFVSLPRFASLRFVILEILLVLISATSIFSAPDTPDLTAEGLWAFTGMFFVMNVLVFGNILIARRFIRHRNPVKYFTRGGIFLLVMLAVIIVVQYLSYRFGVMGQGLPVIYTILSTVASFAAIALLLGGVAAFIALQQWLNGRRRLTRLHNETSRLELSILQSQINPHFLFNVLNNVGMLIYESATDAASMLNELKELLSYQLLDAEREFTTPGAEAGFISSYLSLEKSRKDPFDFRVDIADNIHNIKIPTLVIIPFIENAAKHSNVVDGRRDIQVKMTTQNGKFCMQCTNTFNPALKNDTNSVGGLGIRNTLRRLQLIFDNNFSLIQKTENCKYEVTLSIPISN